MFQNFNIWVLAFCFFWDWHIRGRGRAGGGSLCFLLY